MIRGNIPKIWVLMSTYNGMAYIEEQIESILSQKNCDVHLLVRDDGSTDATLDILKSYEKKGSLIISPNFLSHSSGWNSSKPLPSKNVISPKYALPFTS